MLYNSRHYRLHYIIFYLILSLISTNENRIDLVLFSLACGYSILASIYCRFTWKSSNLASRTLEIPVFLADIYLAVSHTESNIRHAALHLARKLRDSVEPMSRYGIATDIISKICAHRYEIALTLYRRSVGRVIYDISRRDLVFRLQNSTRDYAK